ncbi:MAG: hypothetical protein R3C45_21045 [Phycisphaerales bacterium]
MRTTRIDLEGDAGTGHYATITRPRNSEHIIVTILTPAEPEGRVHHVQADSEDDVWSMAECLQHQLDGVRGTNSMIHDYLRELQRFAD